MGSLTNGLTNGHDHSPEPRLGPQRFSDIPSAIDIPVSGGDDEEAVELNLETLPDDATELCTLLENENVAKGYWMTIALAYAKQSKLDYAIEMLSKGLGALRSGRPEEKLSLLACLCWLYLWKSRDAPRTIPDNNTDPDSKTKDFYLRTATTTLNDASRISPSFPPLFLARGVLYLLRAALPQDQIEKVETLRQALKCFEDALRASSGKNMMAVLGRSRAHFTMGKYAEALQGYQHVLERSPDISDPDPRIGIGCCFWQLGYKDDAQIAWQRALEINSDSKIANILMGLYHLHSSSQLATSDPQFALLYKKAMTQYTQKAFKLDNKLPLACAAFGGYLLVRKAWPQVETLARKAIELTDINAIASDGWYLLARKEHYSNDLAKASDYYLKADQARGGDEYGYLPAKFGAIQLKVLMGDVDGAKFRLERMIQQTKSLEAMTLLGTLFAEEVFAASPTMSKEEQTLAVKKAISLLESVRVAWKDPKRHMPPDASVLLNLARLYEVESPEKSLQCLQQVEQIEFDDLPDDVKPQDVEDEVAVRAALREYLPPQLLNNMGCFHFQAERYAQARDYFQTGLNACVRVGDRDDGSDTDALVTTISYNLARTYEAESMLDEAKKIYEGLLERHTDYTDANTRLTYIALRQAPTEEGPKAMAKLFEMESANLEVRSLYGWFLRKAKRRTGSIAEDQEQRHYKHTLQGHDKHDRYSLTGMGNLYLQTAREMRRETDQEKDKRRKMYERAVEFYDKALQLDPRNAYAAQGIGIAMIEDKKDFAAGLQIFSKVRETVKDPSVFINLGHVYCEVKQYSRAIESYETALAKDRAKDPQILACLGRAWLLRGKQERSLQAMNTSLEYSQRALQVAPNQIHFRFNVAFVQIQIAQLLYSLHDAQRTLEEVETAANGLDAAIESFSAIAKSPNPPFPRHDIEQRANMGRNTMRKQLERAVQSQREYEQKNAERLQQARQLREVEISKRAEEKRVAEEAVVERRRHIAEERQRMQEHDRELAEARAEEEKRKEEEFSQDEEIGERKKKSNRKARKRKKKGDEIDFGSSEDESGQRSQQRSEGSVPAGSADERPRQKKKRRLERRSKKPNTYKSDERVIDSDSDDDEEAVAPTNGSVSLAEAADSPVDVEDSSMHDAAADEPPSQPRKRLPKRVLDEDDDDEEEVKEKEEDTKSAVNGVRAANKVAATSPDNDSAAD